MPFDAAQLLIMLSLLALLHLQHYWIATWGAWLVVVCLLSAPFWFNPQTFDSKNVVVRLLFARHSQPPAAAAQQDSCARLSSARKPRPIKLGIGCAHVRRRAP